MPPPKSIIVNPPEILRAIDRISTENRKALEQHLAELPSCGLSDFAEYQAKCAIEHDLKNADWVKRDLNAIAGREITASERIRYQQAVRKLADDDLLWIDTVWLKLSPTGRELVEGLK
jgi:cytochrome c2